MTIKITTPLTTICCKDGKPIKGMTKCVSDLEVAEKLAQLPPGSYTLIRPPVKVVIK